MDVFEFDEEDSPPRKRPEKRKRVDDGKKRSSKRRKKMVQSKLEFVTSSGGSDMSQNSQSRSQEMVGRKKSPKPWIYPKRDNKKVRKRNMSRKSSTSRKKSSSASNRRKKKKRKESSSSDSDESSSSSDDSSSSTSSSSSESDSSEEEDRKRRKRRKKRLKTKKKKRKKKKPVKKVTTVISISSDSSEDDEKPKTTSSKITKLSSVRTMSTSRDQKKKKKKAGLSIPSNRTSSNTNKKKTKKKKFPSQTQPPSFEIFRVTKRNVKREEKNRTTTTTRTKTTSSSRKMKKREIPWHVKHAKVIHNALKETINYRRIRDWLEFQSQQEDIRKNKKKRLLNELSSSISSQQPQQSRSSRSSKMSSHMGSKTSNILLITAYPGSFSTDILREIISNHGKFEQPLELNPDSTISYSVIDSRRRNAEANIPIDFTSSLMRLDEFLSSSQAFNIQFVEKNNERNRIRVVGSLPRPTRINERKNLIRILNNLIPSSVIPNNNNNNNNFRGRGGGRRRRRRRRMKTEGYLKQRPIILIHWIYDTNSMEKDLSQFFSAGFLMFVNRINVPKISETQTKTILTRIISLEREKIKKEDIELIASHSKGDIISSIQQLSFHLLLDYNKRNTLKRKRKKTATKKTQKPKKEIIVIDDEEEEKSKNKSPEPIDLEFGIIEDEEIVEFGGDLLFDITKEQRPQRQPEEKLSVFEEHRKDRNIVIYHAANKILFSKKKSSTDTQKLLEFIESEDLLIDYLYHNYPKKFLSDSSSSSSTESSFEQQLLISECFSAGNLLTKVKYKNDVYSTSSLTTDVSRTYSEWKVLPNYEYEVISKSLLLHDRLEEKKKTKKKKKKSNNNNSNNNFRYFGGKVKQQVNSPENRNVRYVSKENFRVVKYFFGFFGLLNHPQHQFRKPFQQYNNNYFSTSQQKENQREQQEKEIEEKKSLMLRKGFSSNMDIFVDYIPFIRQTPRIFHNLITKEQKEFLRSNLAEYSSSNFGQLYGSTRRWGRRNVMVDEDNDKEEEESGIITLNQVKEGRNEEIGSDDFVDEIEDFSD